MKKLMVAVALMVPMMSQAASLILVAKCPTYGVAVYEKTDGKNKITAFGKVYPLTDGTDHTVVEDKVVTAQFAAINDNERAAFMFSDDDLRKNRVFVVSSTRKGEFCKLTDFKVF